jgi:hypothetical protein
MFDLLDAEVTLTDHELPKLEEHPKGSEEQKRRHGADGNRERAGALEETRKSEIRNPNLETNPNEKEEDLPRSSKRREDRISED